MLKVTEPAQTQIAEYFKSNQVKPVRIFLNQGCGGAQMALALETRIFWKKPNRWKLILQHRDFPSAPPWNLSQPARGAAQQDHAAPKNILT